MKDSPEHPLLRRCQRYRHRVECAKCIFMQGGTAKPSPLRLGRRRFFIPTEFNPKGVFIMLTQAPKGTQDMLPKDAHRW